MPPANTTQVAPVVKKTRQSKKVHDANHPIPVKDWAFTRNNYTEAHVAEFHLFAQQDNVQYCCFAKEVCGTTGTPHIQGYVYFRQKREFSAVLKDLPDGSHIEARYATIEAARDYCLKTRDNPLKYENGIQNTQVWEYGVCPMTQKTKGTCNLERYTVALALAKSGDHDEIDADIRFRHYNVIKQIHLDYLPTPVPLHTENSWWYHGKSHSGKTHASTEPHPGYYPKNARHKWWGGYINQEVVVIQEWGKTALYRDNAEALKEWADRVPFDIEFKGGQRAIRPRKLVVTSQYSLKECFGYDPEVLEAMESRFKVIYFPGEWYQVTAEDDSPWAFSETRLDPRDPRKRKNRSRALPIIAQGGMYVQPVDTRPDNVCMDERPCSPINSHINVPEGRCSPTELALRNQQMDDLFGVDPVVELEESLEDILRANAVL